MNAYHADEASESQLTQELQIEMLKYFRSENQKRDRERHERQLTEIRNKRWGYPVPRDRRRN